MKRLPDLPDIVIEVTRQLINDGEGYQWRLGDHIASVVDELGDKYAGFIDDTPQAEGAVRRARAHIIRQLADRTGTDRSTLRDRENMARFFPPIVRGDLVPLTYHQLRACKSAGPDWQKHAEWALENLPAPPAIIRLRIKHKGELPLPWVARWDRFLQLANDLFVDDAAPDRVRAVARSVIESI